MASEKTANVTTTSLVQGFSMDFSIPNRDFNKSKRQIKGELIAFIYELDKCSVSEETQAIILEQMKSCVGTLRSLINYYQGKTEDLPTPIGTPQQFDDAMVNEDVNKTFKKSKKTG